MATNKELQEYLKKFPDDAAVYVRVVTDVEDGYNWETAELSDVYFSKSMGPRLYIGRDC